MSEHVSYYYDRLQQLLQRIDFCDIEKTLSVLVDRLLSGNLICTVGNGGSSANASHFVNDWIKGIRTSTGLPIRALCLSDNTPTLTAIANDIGYDQVFSFQVESLMKKGDMLVCISGSGNSRNVINAVMCAKQMGVQTLALTGFDGGQLLKMCDFNINFPIEDMQIVEDLHSTIGHIILKLATAEINIRK